MKLFYTILFAVLIALLSYLIGSIPIAKIIARIHGIDILKEGSKNAGGTNVGRVVGKKAGILTMFLDALKCYIPCLITLLIFQYAPMELLHFSHEKEVYVSFAGLFVAIGHSFPLFSHFKGGKCVACFAGFVFFVSPLIFVLGASTFFLVFFLKKKVSLASLIGAPTTLGLFLIPMVLDWTVLKDETLFDGGLYFSPTLLVHLSYVTAIAAFLYVCMIVIRHKANIKRLEKGVEPDTHFKKD